MHAVKNKTRKGLSKDFENEYDFEIFNPKIKKNTKSLQRKLNNSKINLKKPKNIQITLSL